MSKIKDQNSKIKISEALRADFINFAFCTLIFSFLFAGCEQPEQDADALSIAQEAEVISIPSNEAQQAIKATGGLNTWKKTAQLQLDCVVTFYQPDGSFYLTEQHYEVHPWLNTIRISADEPQGTFVWKWSEGKFDVLKGPGQIDVLSKAVPSCCFAEAILDIITAPVRFLDGPVEFSERSDPVRIRQMVLSNSKAGKNLCRSYI